MDYKEKIIALLNSQELSKEQKEKLESIFPELKESEDERIRKGLIRCVKGNMPDNDFRKKYIAWLEKQGAKVSAIEGFETEFERQVSGLIASAINKEHEYNQGYVKWTANALLNYAKHELEKQGEQKSIDDLTQQEAMDIAVAKCFEQGEQKPAEFDDTNAKRMFIKALERVEEQNTKGYKLTDCDKNSWWEDFKNYTFCTIEQKPAWSEEDETTKNNISHIIRQYDKISKRENKPCWYIGDCLLWMQNIKDRVQLQPKQEWSEEEKARIDKIVDVLDWAEEKGYIRYSDWEDYVCYAKSLRPQTTWKPSDEQMKTLKKACDKHWEPDGLDPLYTLYQDLKKLREE